MLDYCPEFLANPNVPIRIPMTPALAQRGTSESAPSAAMLALADEYVPVLCWDTSLSESLLTFTAENCTAFRPGNVGCYPAALAAAPRSAKSSFTAGL